MVGNNKECPILAPPNISWETDVNTRIQVGITFGKYSGWIRAGDAIVIVRGNRSGAGFTNTMHVVYASEFDVLTPLNDE